MFFEQVLYGRELYLSLGYGMSGVAILYVEIYVLYIEIFMD